MSGITRIATTWTEGWQEQCRIWAAEGESFEIQGIGARHLGFCKDLCGEFDYECHYHSHGHAHAAIMTPAGP
jgi:hypothetical protein